MSKSYRDYKHQNPKKNMWLLKEEHKGLFNYDVEGIKYQL